ncbi:MAG: hypothetical protein DCF25_17205 [Leptolyngbya foveolarum]|uniref:Ribbon-helix-helix protein CopG domain-containing protein n=1 Tax=Leptolyngbya foveolarum TaxID=47253 RepID=A0A2W4TYA3_9CYAN|nr:MAG: hypothetical protein DCF25_17205 [Leptolyngbya foveolarum]
MVTCAILLIIALQEAQMKREKRVPIMFSEVELAKLDKLAEKEGVSRAEMIRKLVDRASS